MHIFSEGSRQDPSSKALRAVLSTVENFALHEQNKSTAILGIFRKIFNTE